MNLKSNSDLEISIVDSVAAEKLTDIGADLAELALDALTGDNGALEAFPVVGNLVKLIKVGFSVPDKLFLNKLGEFLLELQKIDLAERAKFVDELDNDIKHKKKVGANLLILLDRLDDIEKPALIGKLFRAHILGEIDYHTFRRLSAAIDKVFLPDLIKIHDFGDDDANAKAGEDDASLSLINAGLLVDAGSFIGPMYILSASGKLLIELLYKRP